MLMIETYFFVKQSPYPIYHSAPHAAGSQNAKIENLQKSGTYKSFIATYKNRLPFQKKLEGKMFEKDGRVV